MLKLELTYDTGAKIFESSSIPKLTGTHKTYSFVRRNKFRIDYFYKQIPIAECSYNKKVIKLINYLQ